MKFKSVFDCYPGVDLIHVVGDMPFLKAGEAETHAKMVGGKVEVVKRASQYEDTTVLEPFGEPDNGLVFPEGLFSDDEKSRLIEMAATPAGKAAAEVFIVARAEKAEREAAEKAKGEVGETGEEDASKQTDTADSNASEQSEKAETTAKGKGGKKKS